MSDASARAVAARSGLAGLGAALALALVLTGAGCASVPPGPADSAQAAGGAAAGAAAATAAEDGEDDFRRRSRRVDPFEPLNRQVARFNDAVDRGVVRPLATFYDRYTPQVFRLIIGNVLSNLLDPYIAVNNFLQGKVGAGFSDLGRFAFNSTFGFFGFGDPASEMGLVKHREDFGQTLGAWGVPPGPYLVLPLFGPSNVRDGIGFGVDVYGALLNRFDSIPLRNTVAGFDFLEARARLLPGERVLQDALDRYLLVRDSYLQRRRYLIHDGNPPEDD